MTDQQTQAEKDFKAEIDTARNELIDQIKAFKPDTGISDFQLEQEHPRCKHFAVTDPALGAGATTKYTVHGIDGQGNFKIIRRFNEFHALMTQLRSRWPGIYIPSVPEKDFK